MPVWSDLETGETPTGLSRFGWGFQPTPEWLRHLAQRVLAYFEEPGPVAVRVAYGSNADRSGTLWVWETDEGDASGYRAGAEKDPNDPDELVRFADWLQEQFFPDTQGAWGEARPRCPGHSHPACAVVIDREAWWTCPSDGRQLGRIGELARQSRDS